MFTDQCKTTAAIKRKFQEEVKWGNNQAKEKSSKCSLLVHLL